MQYINAHKSNELAVRIFNNKTKRLNQLFRVVDLFYLNQSHSLNLSMEASTMQKVAVIALTFL